MNFNTIPEALQDLKQGKIILVTDDPDRENEGDFICAAEFATTENINFMATHGKGLICMPMSEAFVQKLQFPQMVQHNTDNHETAFTVSIDHSQASLRRPKFPLFLGTVKPPWECAFCPESQPHHVVNVTPCGKKRTVR